MPSYHCISVRRKRQAGSYQFLSSEPWGLSLKYPPQSYVLNAYSETDPVGEGLEPLGHGASLGGSGPLGVALEVVPSPRSCMALLSIYGEIKQLSLAHSPVATDIQLMDQASMD